DMRRQQFRKIRAISAKTKAVSFITLMDAQPPQERALVDHDQSIFESLVARGECESATFSEGLRNLRVWTVDKSKVERITGTGVDLVILNQDYNSLLLLQYKCMELGPMRTSKQCCYRF